MPIWGLNSGDGTFEPKSLFTSLNVAPSLNPKFSLLQGESSWLSEPKNHLKYLNLVNSNEFNGAISITKVKINGKHLDLITKSNVRIYILINGNLTFEIEETKGIELKPGAVLTLKSGTKYNLEGKAEYLVINAPAFKDSDDLYL